MLKCQRLGCDADATCVAGVTFYPLAGQDGADVSQVVARGNLGLSMCAEHMTELRTRHEAMILSGSAVQAAVRIIEQQSGYAIDRTRLSLIALSLDSFEVEMAEHVHAGLIHRPFKATAPTGAWLN